MSITRQSRLVPEHINLSSEFDKPIHLPNRGPAIAEAATPARITVTVDTWIARPDLAPGNRTFVVAGDNVPIGLEGYTRTPA